MNNAHPDTTLSTLYVGPTFEHTLVHFNSHTRAMPTLARISDVPHDSLQ